MWSPLSGGLVAVPGFRAAGVACGIKKRKRDLALVVADSPCAAAGVFTQSAVKAAPVLLCQEVVAGGKAQAIVCNSGVANACSGEQGLRDARRMARWAAEALGTDPGHVLVASTGVIGPLLPMERIGEGIRAAAAEIRAQEDAAGRLRGGEAAAEAILTTDTRRKEFALRLHLDDGIAVTIGGFAKGSGMIRPNMATMLAFLATDAAIGPEALQQALRLAVAASFNRITVDNDTSTNDTVLLLASGAAGNAPLIPGTEGFERFVRALEEVCTALAKEIVRDGEGATRLIEVAVRGAESEGDAERAALAVAGSALVKTAVFGADANWGRIMAALGYSGARFDPGQVGVFLGPLKLVEKGMGLAFDEVLARTLLEQSEVRFEIDLGAGLGRATAWGCDLSYDYVRINGSYRS